MEEQNIIIYKAQDGKVKLSLYARDGSVWMNQNQIAELFAAYLPKSEYRWSSGSSPA